MTSLMILALLAQVYVWTDASGGTHYTDDRSTIPKGVKVRTTEGDELSVITPDARARDAGVSSPRRLEEVDTCAAAREQVSRVEARLDAAKKKTEQARLTWNGDCLSVLNLHGDAAYAQCMAGGRRSRRSPQSPDPAVVTAPIERDLEQARDGLRRAQVAGCR